MMEPIDFLGAYNKTPFSINMAKRIIDKFYETNADLSHKLYNHKYKQNAVCILIKRYEYTEKHCIDELFISTCVSILNLDQKDTSLLAPLSQWEFTKQFLDVFYTRMSAQNIVGLMYACGGILKNQQLAEHCVKLAKLVSSTFFDDKTANRFMEHYLVMAPSFFIEEFDPKIVSTAARMFEVCQKKMEEKK